MISDENLISEIQDLELCGSEIAYRAEDLWRKLPTVPQNIRKKIVAASLAASKLVNRVGDIRIAIGMTERPNP